MKTTVSGLTAAAALLAGGLVASTAQAQGTWNLGGSSCNPGAGSPTEASCTVGTVSATIEAWGKNAAGTAFVQYNLGAYDPNGFGARMAGGNETSYNGHHAFDNVTYDPSNATGTRCGTSASPATTNCGGTQEFMLLNFGAAKVNLSSVAIGWWSGDADMSIYRWDGGNTGQTSGSTLSSSWSLVASEDVDQGAAWSTGQTRSLGTTDATALKCTTANCANLYSSWWLVSTYAGAQNDAYNLKGGNDKFKVYSFTANVCAGTVNGGNGGNGGSCGPGGGSAPEPASLALVAVALSGTYALRRRASRIATPAA